MILRFLRSLRAPRRRGLDPGRLHLGPTPRGTLRSGCTPEQLDAFEAHTGFVLPPDLRVFLALLDGRGSDGNGFELWPLRDYESVADYEGGRHDPGLDDPHRYFVFCDYLVWSWGYAIRLSRPGEEDAGNPVVAVGVERIYQIADSFTEFMDLVRVDAMRLYLDD